MKNTFYFLSIALVLFSCESDDYLNSVERNVVSRDESVPFEELLILVNIKPTDSTYLVVKSVDSVNIFVNNNYWTKTNSQPLDTAKVEKFPADNTYQTYNRINYLIIASQDIKEPDFNTAGEIARYLNSSYDLEPGEYVCLIESFQVTFNDNSTKKYYPFEYKRFKVDDNSRSAFVDEIELKIN